LLRLYALLGEGTQTLFILRRHAMFTAKFARRLVPALTVAGIALAGCNDMTSPTTTAEENQPTAAATPTATDDTSSSAATAAPQQGPSFATLGVPSGSVGKVATPYPSVSCGSVPEIALRAISVKGPTVYGVYSPYIASEKVHVQVVLKKWINGAWVPVARREFKDWVSITTTAGTRFPLADFGLVGPGSYTVTSLITWYYENMYTVAFVQLGQQRLSYTHAADYGITGAVTKGAGYCTIR
jgi:hypothetical protein